MWDFLKKYTYENDDKEQKTLYDNYSYLQKQYLLKDPSCFTSIGGILDQASRLLAKKINIDARLIFSKYLKIPSFKNKILQTGFSSKELNKLNNFYYVYRGSASHGRLQTFKEEKFLDGLELLYNYLKCIFTHYFDDQDIPNFDRTYYIRLQNKILKVKTKNY